MSVDGDGDGDGDEAVDAQRSTIPADSHWMRSFQELDVYRCATELLAQAKSISRPRLHFLSPICYAIEFPDLVNGLVAVQAHENAHVYDV